MKYNLIIEPEREEEVIVYAHKRSELTDRIEAVVISENEELIGYTEQGVIRLDLSDVYAFTVEDSKVYALTEREKIALKLRLYQLEERFSYEFLKINQSCLVNVKIIKRFDSSIGGSLMVELKNGYRDYVSRRQIKAVKERIGF